MSVSPLKKKTKSLIMRMKCPFLVGFATHATKLVIIRGLAAGHLRTRENFRIWFPVV
ncbi:hypothetical protein DAI22_02g252600 [Oryza sativa Japonica Group]|nr:hypothetical protein DAI22_02g252600 [Oryza sativa Japonica Group]